MDWAPPQGDGRPALANFVFDGGRIDNGPGQNEPRLRDGELSGWTLAAPREWDDLLSPHMARPGQGLRQRDLALEPTVTTPSGRRR